MRGWVAVVLVSSLIELSVLRIDLAGRQEPTLEGNCTLNSTKANRLSLPVVSPPILTKRIGPHWTKKRWRCSSVKDSDTFPTYIVRDT